MPDTNPPSLPEPSSTIRSKGRANTRSSSDPVPSGEPLKKVHLVLQGKGGVGKSFVASLLTQFYQEKGQPIVSLDTDPVNGSLSAIPALQAQHVPLLDGDKINVDALDELVERVVTEDSNFVVDNGAASFVPLSRYLIEHDIAGLIAEGGKQVVVHTIITGGPALIDTGKALRSVIQQFPASVELIVWLNEYFGPIAGSDGQTFEQSPIYLNNRERIAGIVRLDRLNPDTFGRNLSEMMSRHLTFAEADLSTEFRIVARQRLRQIWRPIRDQIALVV
jgi:hypothetical protein